MDDGSQIARVAREIVELFGECAAHIAHKLAEISEEVQYEMLTSAETWHEIADALIAARRGSTTTEWIYNDRHLVESLWAQQEE